MLDGPNYPAESQVPLKQHICCQWYDEAFTRRQDGGKPQRFCQPKCRAKFHKAARIWTEWQLAEGRLAIEELRVVL